MAYNRTTRSFTLGNDDQSDPFRWIVENLDPADSAGMTDEQIGAWVDTLIEQTIEQDGFAIEAQAEELTFPRYGYTTDDVFEDSESWRAFKHQELLSDLQAERESVIAYLKNWIASGANAR